MKYRIHFTTGESMLISEEEFNALVKDDNLAYKGLLIVDNVIVAYINSTHITHILPEHTLEQGSAVVKPPSPNQMKVEEQRRRELELRDPKRVLGKIHQRGEEERGIEDQD